MGFEDVPIWLGDTISSFPAIDSSKVKRAMDECIVMCQINSFTKWKQFVPSGIILRGI